MNKNTKLKLIPNHPFMFASKYALELQLLMSIREPVIKCRVKVIEASWSYLKP